MLKIFNIIPVDTEIAEIVIGIKQKRKVKLPDAIIYATALNLKCDLITNNVSDFEGIGLQVRIIEAEIT